jgi:Resolvase, N terminal domain
MHLGELCVNATHRRPPVAVESIDQVNGGTSEPSTLARQFTAVRGRKVNTVLVWKFDRFTRSIKQLTDALEEGHYLPCWSSHSRSVPPREPLAQATMMGTSSGWIAVTCISASRSITPSTRRQWK